MTTDQTDSLLDLLYGELSEEDEKLIRDELADSAELRAELDGYEDLLGQVRDAMPVEEVPSSVHASIMDAARSAVENPEERGGRRSAPEPERQGVWRRLSGGQGSQIALVAAVLIAGVFVVKFMGPANAPSPGDISAVQEAAPAPTAAADEAAAPTDKPAEAVAEQIAGVAEEPEAPAPSTITEEADEEYGVATRRDQLGDSSAQGRGAADKKSAEKSLANELSKSAKVQPTEPDTKPRPKPAPSRRARSTRSKAAPEKAQDSDLFGGESANAPELKSESTSSKDRAFDLDQIVAGEAEDAPETSQAPAAAAKEDDAKAYRPPDNSLSSVTQRWQNSDYNGTIREADEFLATGEGSSTDRARALELKAQSLARLGQYQAADRIYEQIERNYPGYQTAAISQARDEVKQKMRKRPKRKKNVAPQESYEAMPAADSLD